MNRHNLIKTILKENMMQYAHVDNAAATSGKYEMGFDEGLNLVRKPESQRTADKIQQLVDTLVNLVRKGKYKIEVTISGFWITPLDMQKNYYILPYDDRPENGWYIQTDDDIYYSLNQNQVDQFNSLAADSNADELNEGLNLPRKINDESDIRQVLIQAFEKSNMGYQLKKISVNFANISTDANYTPVEKRNDANLIEILLSVGTMAGAFTFRVMHNMNTGENTIRMFKEIVNTVNGSNKSEIISSLANYVSNARRIKTIIPDLMNTIDNALK